MSIRVMYGVDHLYDFNAHIITLELRFYGKLSRVPRVATTRRGCTGYFMPE